MFNRPYYYFVEYQNEPYRMGMQRVELFPGIWFDLPMYREIEYDDAVRKDFIERYNNVHK